MAISKISGLVGAAIAALVLPATPAFAQEGLSGLVSPEQEAEIYCVYDLLSQSGDTYAIADVFIDPDATEGDIDAADEILSYAIEECMAAYEWTETMREYAAVIGIHGSVIDVVTADLLAEGVEQEHIQAIFEVLDLLDEKDMEVFRSPDWLSNTRFQKRMSRSLVAAGIPNEQAVLDNSLLVMESAILSVEAIVDWMLEAPTSSADAGKASGGGSKKSKSARAGSTGTPAARAPKLQLVSTGTGWYVADGGLIVTNGHVTEGCKAMRLKSGADLEMLGTYGDEDLALLRGAASVRPLQIRDTRGVRLAEDVLVAGYPLGSILGSGINVTVGTVSSLTGGGDTKRFQFTAPVQPGNSGGPVLDMSGNVIGVVVAKLNAMSVQDQYGDIPQNVNFGIALPSLLDFLDENDIDYVRKPSGPKLDKVDLAELARASTVLLECYQ
jgi:S1-C subfamily serine protease